MKTIKGNLLGLSKNNIEKQLIEKEENQDIKIRKNYMQPEYKKLIFKKNNITLSIISDHYLVGFDDTVDPYTHNRCDDIINSDIKFFKILEQLCVKKIECNIIRLQEIKREIFSQIKESITLSSLEIKNNNNFHIDSITKNISPNKVDSAYNLNIPFSINDIDSKSYSNIDDKVLEKNNNYIGRNSIYKTISKSNKKILTQLKLNSNVIENTLNTYKYFDGIT